MSKSRPDVSKMTHGFFITINSMILYFKHIVHIDDFPLNGNPPSFYYNWLDRLVFLGIFFTLSSNDSYHACFMYLQQLCRKRKCSSRDV